MNWEQLSKLGRELPEVEKDIWYRTAALKVRGKGFCRLKEDGQSVVFLVDSLDEQEALIEAQSDIYFITDHYRGYAMVLARLDALSVPEARLRFGQVGALHVWVSKDLSPMKLHAVPVQHQGPDQMVDAFAEAVRSPQDEKQMESLLASVDPRIRTVRLDSVQSKPFIVVDVGLSERVPLSQAGQGIYRLVAIFSELLGHKPKICFVDEIENGIHYSALPKVWAGIAEVAARLDIQVFATTHSWECLLAAHEVFAARDPYDLRVLQLYRLNDAVSGRVLDREHIQAAIAGDIELR